MGGVIRMLFELHCLRLGEESFPRRHDLVLQRHHRLDKRNQYRLHVLDLSRHGISILVETVLRHTLTSSKLWSSFLRVAVMLSNSLLAVASASWACMRHDTSEVMSQKRPTSVTSLVAWGSLSSLPVSARERKMNDDDAKAINQPLSFCSASCFLRSVTSALFHALNSEMRSWKHPYQPSAYTAASA